MSEALRKTALAKSRSAEDSADASQLSFEPNYLYVRFLAEGKKGACELKKYLMEKYPSDVNGRSYSKAAMDNLFNYWAK